MEHRDLRRVRRAQAVDQHQGVRDVAGSVEIVDHGHYAVLLAARCRARARAEERINDRAIGIEHDGDRLANRRRLNVRGHGYSARAGCDIGSVHVFAQKSLEGDLDRSGRDRVPHGDGCWQSWFWLARLSPWR